MITLMSCCHEFYAGIRQTEFMYPAVPFWHPCAATRTDFSMTINKSQSQTLSFVGIYLKNHVFTHGLLYIVVSWVTSGKSLKLLIKDKMENVHPRLRTSSTLRFMPRLVPFEVYQHGPIIISSSLCFCLCCL